MIQQDFGHLIRQPKVPTKFENLPILRDFRLKSHIFESCHLDQLQKAELRKKLVIQPFLLPGVFCEKQVFSQNGK